MKILEKIEIIQGDPSPSINLGVSGAKSLSGYTCETKVIDESGEIVVPSRKITEIIVDGTKEVFAVNLRAAETESLMPESLYIWTIEISNDTVFYKEETNIGLLIKSGTK